MIQFLRGKKTYIVAIIAALTAGAEALGYTIPGWLYLLESAAGIGAVRAAISKNGGSYQAPPS